MAPYVRAVAVCGALVPNLAATSVVASPHTWNTESRLRMLKRGEHARSLPNVYVYGALLVVGGERMKPLATGSVAKAQPTSDVVTS